MIVPVRSKNKPRSEQALAEEADDDVPDEVPEPQEADVQPRDTEEAPGDTDGRGEEQMWKSYDLSQLADALSPVAIAAITTSEI
jgi:hypothetical protein